MLTWSLYFFRWYVDAGRQSLACLVFFTSSTAAWPSTDEGGEMEAADSLPLEMDAMIVVVQLRGSYRGVLVAECEVRSDGETRENDGQEKKLGERAKGN